MADLTPSLSAALSNAARSTGVSLAYLTETARRESAFDADAKAATSTASGLFQFIERTWMETLARHGGEFGLDAAAAARVLDGGASLDERDRVLALRFDPGAAALMAGALARDNADRLEAALGRAPRDGELYAAHVLGAGGAARLIAAAAEDPTQAAADIFPQAAEANRGLFYAEGSPVSARGLLDRLASIHAVPVSAPGPDLAPSAAPARASAGVVRRAPALMLSSAVVAALALLDAPRRGEDDAV